ncbi:hypothetical protein FNV43_RR00360 [Rhamnella rubrinervis]|uniref:Uncharacterized protein n=1 Tax=Rhamnella rubrinervis TaxID=2594499 RepID=A0A8K0HPE8_9ROSA|nr:hypothetical protein FNV43_RR00360 [Rhamnella rubrinervis]
MSLSVHFRLGTSSDTTCNTPTELPSLAPPTGLPGNTEEVAINSRLVDPKDDEEEVDRLILACEVPDNVTLDKNKRGGIMHTTSLKAVRELPSMEALRGFGMRCMGSSVYYYTYKDNLVDSVQQGDKEPALQESSRALSSRKKAAPFLATNTRRPRSPHVLSKLDPQSLVYGAS